MSMVNEPVQGLFAGDVRILGIPEGGKTIAATWHYMMSLAAKNREWVWKMLQYLRGRAKAVCMQRQVTWHATRC